ncbi:GDSL-type esterase/lipase family protein [Puniceicoccaceae bacterium K14]|nr:GDSL-type esterase/lipase family protein [Puniceicoccaceae bacterium K14]
MDIEEYERLSDPMRWESDVLGRAAASKEANAESPTLLLGSSTFVMWKGIEEALELSNARNHSFGGSTIFDILYYLDRLVLDFAPKSLIVCSGDNDLGRGRRPLLVAHDSIMLAKLVWYLFPDTKIGFVSIKASAARWELKAEQDEVNRRVKEFCDGDDRLRYLDIVPVMTPDGKKPVDDLFLEDGLHLSEKGYELWRSALVPQLQGFIS